MPSPKKFMKMCLDLADSSSAIGPGKRRSKHGAILVKNGRIIGVGVNAMRGTASVHATVDSWRGSYVHAEEVAIQVAGTRANGAVLYVARVNRSGEPCMSEPCLRCQGAIDRAGIRRVVST